MRLWPISAALVIIGVSAQYHLTSQSVEPSALWKGIKATLLRSEGRDYFKMTMKDAIMPPLVGTIISSKPKGHPNELLISMEHSKTPDVKLRLNRRLQQPFPQGTLVSFEGVGREFTIEPFMVTFDAISVNRAPARKTSSEPLIGISW
jgi:hypothetical protein